MKTSELKNLIKESISELLMETPIHFDAKKFIKDVNLRESAIDTFYNSIDWDDAEFEYDEHQRIEKIQKAINAVKTVVEFSSALDESTKRLIKLELKRAAARYCMGIMMESYNPSAVKSVPAPISKSTDNNPPAKPLVRTKLPTVTQHPPAPKPK